MNIQVLDTRRDLSGGYKLDVNRGDRVGRVSSEWFSRPDDERFLSLGELARALGQLPAHCVVYAIEGECCDLGAPLSQRVNAALPEVVRRLGSEISGNPSGEGVDVFPD